MKESCCQFGPRAQLAGILTEPAAFVQRPTLVLVSAGVTPKLGPFRLYAELARRLAREGIRTLRFDLGGIGDSGPAYEEHALQQRTQLQLRSALDYLSQRHGSSSFALAGLCSGAEDSFRYAEQDSRVVAVSMVDPFAYRTRGFAWRELVSRGRRRLLRALGLFEPLARGNARSLVDYPYMPMAESSRILRALLARQVRLHFIYTGGMARHFNHRSQLRAMFSGVDFRGLVGLDHLPGLDHTQPFAADRRILIEAIAQRLTTQRAGFLSAHGLGK